MYFCKYLGICISYIYLYYGFDFGYQLKVVEDPWVPSIKLYGLRTHIESWGGAPKTKFSWYQQKYLWKRKKRHPFAVSR